MTKTCNFAMHVNYKVVNGHWTNDDWQWQRYDAEKWKDWSSDSRFVCK